MGTAALAGVLIGAPAASRADSLPQHPAVPYQQVAALPETADRIFRRLRAAGSTEASPVEADQNKRARQADFDLPEGRRSATLRNYNTLVAGRQAAQSRS